MLANDEGKKKKLPGRGFQFRIVLTELIKFWVAFRVWSVALVGERRLIYFLDDDDDDDDDDGIDVKD